MGKFGKIKVGFTQADCVYFLWFFAITAEQDPEMKNVLGLVYAIIEKLPIDLPPPNLISSYLLGVIEGH
ncbi:hypothetical protein D3C85_1831690 [compost metagenome]